MYLVLRLGPLSPNKGTAPTQAAAVGPWAFGDHVFACPKFVYMVKRAEVVERFGSV